MITMYICVTISLMNNCSLSGKFDLRTVTGSEDVETTHHRMSHFKNCNQCFAVLVLYLQKMTSAVMMCLMLIMLTEIK